MNTFKTRSSAKKNVLTTVITFCVMFALAFLGLKVAVVTWLFFEGILLLCFIICLLLTAKTHMELEFRNDTLILYNTGNRQSFSFKDLTQADFLIKQSSKQAQNNTCDLQIADAPFRMYDVENHSELLSYIQNNFPA